MAKENKTEVKKENTAFEQMAEDISMIKKALQALDKLGISRELMTIYITHKTHLGRYKVESVLEAQRQFLDNAVLEK